MRTLDVLLALLALLGDAPVPGGLVNVAEGVRVRVLPSATARSLTVVDAPQALEALEVRDGWVRVRYGSFTGWLRPEGDGGEPGRPERPAGLDEGRLGRALKAFPRPVAARPFGPFDLYTDVASARLLSLLERTASGLAAVHAERYGVRTATEGGRDAIVLFERTSDYEALVAGEEPLARTGPRGHAGRGVAVLSVAAEGLDETRGLLVHEVAHLLNRRTLGQLLPPWLEEGIAEDLALCRFAPDGRVLPDTVRVEVERSRERTTEPGRSRVREITRQRGPLVPIAALAEKARRGGLPSLAALLSMPPDEFVSREERGRSYPMAALFVRFLLSGGLPGSRDAFRGFLGGVAMGESPSHLRLLESLGVELAALDAGFGRWVERLPSR